MDDFSRTSSVSGYSSGFESMLSSPTADQDIWANMQDLRRKMDFLERQTAGFPQSTSTPHAHSRSRCDSTASTGSTVIGSAHELQQQTDLGIGGTQVFQTRMAGDKLLLENQLTLSSENVDVMSRYENVVIKFAIVGEKKRTTTNCTCNQHNCKGSGGDFDQSKMEELIKRLTELETINQRLSAENDELKKRPSDNTGQKQAEEEQTSSVLEFSKETSKAEVEEVVESHEEENNKYIIRSVMDTKADAQISLDEAISQGIINMQKGLYMNHDTGESMRIEEAMTANLIDVTYKITNKTPRQRSSYGIITIKKNVLPKGTLLIKTVKDTYTNEMVSPEVAVKRGLLNKGMTRFLDRNTQQEYHIVDSIEQGLVQIEDEPNKEMENLCCVYKVSGVKDTKTGQMISFHDAILRGIMMKEVGVCKDTTSGKFLYIGYAIISGMLKVDAVDQNK